MTYLIVFASLIIGFYLGLFLFALLAISQEPNREEWYSDEESGYIESLVKDER